MRHIIWLLALASSSASAISLDDLPDLQGRAVVYAGEFEKVSCPIGGKYDCMTWPSDLYKTTRGAEVCFKPTSLVFCSFSCRGVITLDNNRTPTVFFINGMNGEVKKSSMESYRCPSLY